MVVTSPTDVRPLPTSEIDVFFEIPFYTTSRPGTYKEGFTCRTKTRPTKLLTFIPSLKLPSLMFSWFRQTQISPTSHTLLRMPSSPPLPFRPFVGVETDTVFLNTPVLVSGTSSSLKEKTYTLLTPVPVFSALSS